ncbi:MAG: hypothetical protein Q9186_006627 [Xanthomendoza sp. 1 TL-2023]
MVRKATNARPTSQALPHPFTLTSPSTTFTQDRTAASNDTSPKAMGSGQGSQNELPRALRVGQGPFTEQANDRPTRHQIAPFDLTPRSSSESQRSGVCMTPDYGSSTIQKSQSNNPYLRMKDPAVGSTPMRDESSTAVWADQPIRGSDASQSRIPAVENSSPPLRLPSSPKPPFVEPWIDFKQAPEDTTLTTPTNHYNSEVLDPTSQWNEEKQVKSSDARQTMPVAAVSYTSELQELEAQPFGGFADNFHDHSPNEKALPPFPPGSALPHNDWQAPELPPRNPSGTQQSLPIQQNPQERRPNHTSHPAVVTEEQQAKANQQTNQTYQVRSVNWYDASSPVNPRTSPIMVQNANGPCPLLALVNALILSTPAGLETGLIETLRVREQVSLGLLLDTVIDELMSGRRVDAAQDLPDVSELYAFLVNLHTGMNVNPRFVEPITAPTHLMDSPVDASNAQIETRKAGGFEDTPAMRLYATFAVSLIHGWLPRRNHPVCASLSRSAKTYEDAQSLLFVEEDLEGKLQALGLSMEEQRLLEDVTSIKHFLTSSPTQLTDYGLDTITESLRPGAIVILFRNDHFSTLFKEPRSGRIFTLVTDLGYAGHDEVVWESLVDISGEGSEFFSGDFRPVGNSFGNSNRRSAGPTSASDDPGWTTVSRSGGRADPRTSLSQHGATNTTSSASATNAFSQLSIDDAQNKTMPSTTEQEDHDLALAMQLQEEEEERERQEVTARRRREDDLSRAYLDSSGRPNQRGGRPQVPPRGGGARRAPQRKQAEESGDSPPPTYEQAAKGPAYHPPISNAQPTGVNSRTNVNASGSRPRRQTSAYSQTQTANAAFASAGRPTTPIRPRPDKEKDCVVM